MEIIKDYCNFGALNNIPYKSPKINIKYIAHSRAPLYRKGTFKETLTGNQMSITWLCLPIIFGKIHIVIMSRED